MARCAAVHADTMTTSRPCNILKVLKRQALILEMLHNVLYSIIVSKITYAISSWYSFFVKAQIAQINSLFKRAFKTGLIAR